MSVSRRMEQLHSLAYSLRGGGWRPKEADAIVDAIHGEIERLRGLRDSVRGVGEEPTSSDEGGEDDGGTTLP